MEFNVLGQFEVTRQGEALPLGGRIQRSMLAIFVLAANRVVSTDRLIDELWPDEPRRLALGSVHAYVSRLRRLLEPDRRGGDAPKLLLTEPPGYRLRVQADHVDVLRFEDLAEEGRTTLAAGDAARACDLFVEALSLWRGPALADLATEPFAVAEVTRLEEKRLALIEDRMEAGLALGRHGELVAELEALVAAHPYRERLCGQLMLALYRSGRQAEALRAYQTARRLLGEELGIEPNPSLRALEQSILLQDASLDWRPPERVEAGLTLTSHHPTSVPPPTHNQRELPTGTVTFLVTEVDDLLGLWSTKPLAAQPSLVRQAELVTDLIGRHCGTLAVARAEDASTVSVFSSVPDALAAALALQRAIDAAPSSDRPQPRVRIGLHTGEAWVRDATYEGPALARAVGLRNLGHGGQILCSEVTTRLGADALPPDTAFRELGFHRIEGLDHPERVFELRGREQRGEFPPLRSVDAYLHNLPAALTTFVGRKDQVTEVRSLLEAERLVTLTGAGGVGKTRLALRVAADVVDAYPDGVWLVDLAPLIHSDLVASTVARAVGVREQPGRELWDVLSEHCRGRKLLLIFDNCEHLVAGCAALVEQLLQVAPGLRVVATSRQPLGVAGEVVWRVPPLAVPPNAAAASLSEALQWESIRLFVDRARSINSAFVPSDSDAAALALLAARLDGVPLALELAAARVSALTVDQIAVRLDDRFRLLAAPRRRGLARHQTLRETLDWSHDLLSRPEQALFRRLSVFLGGFPLEAAEAIGAGGDVERAEILDLLGELVAKSLVVMEPQRGAARYRLLETIREYAREQLGARDEQTEVSSRHRDFYVDVAVRADDEFNVADDGGAVLDRLDAEQENFRAALNWSLADADGVEAGLRLVGALFPFWNVRGYHREGRSWMEALLGRVSTPTPLASAVARQAGTLACIDDPHGAARLLHQALTLAERCGDRRNAGRALGMLSEVHLIKGDLAGARSFLEAANASARELEDAIFVVETLLRLGWVAFAQGDYAEARRFVHEGQKEGGEGWRYRIRSLHLLGHLDLDQGAIESARRCFEECRTLADSTGDRGHSVVAREGLGLAAAAVGDWPAARQAYEEAVSVAALSPPVVPTEAVPGLGEVAVAEGNHAAARAFLDEALAQARRLGEVHDLARTLIRVGRAANARGEGDAAGRAYREAADLARRSGMPLPLAACLEGMANLELRREPRAAAYLLGAAEALRESIGAPLPPSARPAHDDDVRAAREALGDAALAIVWAEGRALAAEVVDVVVGRNQ